jgi:spore maturation protein CgeB
MRLFEATGAGACLVTDTADDMSDFFAEDEIVTFETAEEAIEKVTYLVRNSAAAADIARRGARRTLKDHTYAVRMEYVARLLGQAIATAR